MKRPMTAPTGTAPLTPEDLLETIARMDKTGGGRQPSTLALAALTGLATAAALVVSVWLLVSFLAPDTLPPARVSQTEVRVQAVAAAEERTADLLLSPDPDALPERLLPRLKRVRRAGAGLQPRKRSIIADRSHLLPCAAMRRAAPPCSPGSRRRAPAPHSTYPPAKTDPRTGGRR